MPKKAASSDVLIAGAKARLLEHRDAYKARVNEKIDNLVYWLSLALLALFNFIACFFLIPFLILLDGWQLYLAVGAFGLAFGLLFNLLILGLEHLEHHHSVIAGIFIPLLAVLDISLILKMTEQINSLFVKPVQYDVPLVILIFISVFVAPYLFSVLTGRHKM
jgi:hypothetical protein